MAAELLATVAQTSWMVLIVSPWSQGASRNGLFFKRPFGRPVFLSEQRRNRHFHSVWGGLVMESRKIAYKVMTCCMHAVIISLVGFHANEPTTLKNIQNICHQVWRRKLSLPLLIPLHLPAMLSDSQEVENIQWANMATRIMWLQLFLV